MKFISIFTIGLFFSGIATSISAQSIECGKPYTVVRGDILGVVSQRAYGAGMLSNFYEVNAGVIGPNPSAIDIGMVLEVPCSLGGATAEAAADEPAPDQTTPEQLTQAVAIAPIREADFSAAPIEIESDGIVTPAPEGAEVVLTFNKAAAPKFIMNVGIIDPYLAKIAEVTAGRVQFVDPANINLDARAQLDLVSSGQVDAAYVFNGYLGASHPLLQLPMQPLMGGTGYQTAVALWRLEEKYLAEKDLFVGGHLLGFIGAPAAHIWRLREAPVVAGEDLVKTNEYTVPYFDGLDTRGAPAVREENASWLAAYDEDQGKPLTFAMAHGAARAGGIWNENRTVTEIANGVYTPTFSVVISDVAWAKISPTDQAAITAISGEELAKASMNWDEFDNGHRRIMIKQGLDVVKADLDLLAELQDRSRGGLDAWIMTADRLGIPGYEAFQFYNDTLQDVALPSEF